MGFTQFLTHKSTLLSNWSAPPLPISHSAFRGGEGGGGVGEALLRLETTAAVIVQRASVATSVRASVLVGEEEREGEKEGEREARVCGSIHPYFHCPFELLLSLVKIE